MTAVNRTITAPEVVIPEEPPAGSVVIARNGMPWARGGGMESWGRPDTGQSGFGPVTLPWSTLVQSEGPLTVVWEPGAQPEQAGQRVHDALAASEAQFLAAEKHRAAEGRLRSANKRLAAVRESNAHRLAAAEDEMADAARAHSATHAELTKAQR